MNHAKLAHNLLYQTAIELEADIVLISEPLRNPGNWVYARSTSNVAIWVTGIRGLKNQEDGNRQEEDFVAVRIGQITVISVYLSPNISPELYATKLEKIESYVKKEKKEGRKIEVGGDFNAKSPAWGSKTQSTEGTLTLEMLLDFDIHPVVPIGGPTFERRNATSNIDFIATSPEIQEGRKLTCKVLKKESASDHKYLMTEIEMEEPRNMEEQRTSKWKVTPSGMIKLSRVLSRRLQERNLGGIEVMEQNQIDEFLQMLPEICDEALERTGQRKARRENPWWSKEISAERNKAQKLSRLRQRAKKRGNPDEAEALHELYKYAKRELNKLIFRAKEKSWNELCETINNDTWGKPYKTIIRRVKGATPPPALSSNLAVEVMTGLFPQENREAGTDSGTEVERERVHSGGQEVGTTGENFHKITVEEIEKAGKLLKTGKAAGSDGMPPEAVKAILSLRPDCFAAMFNGILKSGKIPEQ